MRVPNPDTSNAVLIGTATYQSEELANIPAVYNNVVQLSSTITDPETGGFIAERCTTLLNPVDGRAVYDALRGPAAEATDTFLVYFTGHGLLSARGELYLALANTDPEILLVSALAFDVIKEIFRKSRAVNRVLILDCCYSGRAIEPFMGRATDTALAQVELEVEVGSTVTLASAPANLPALAPPGAPYTIFTGEMIQMLRRSGLERDQPLTIEALYRQLIRTAATQNLPQPQIRGTGPAGDLALTRITRYSNAFEESAQKDAKTVKKDIVRATHILDDAERIAVSFTNIRAEASALAAIAGAMAAIDLYRATLLMGEVERMVQCIHDSSKDLVLVNVAGAMAAIDAGRACRITKSITDKDDKARALADVAAVLVVTDPDRAAHLIADAERIAKSVTDKSLKARALAAIAGVLTAIDPSRAAQLIADAERIAESIIDKSSNDKWSHGWSLKAGALAAIAEVLTAIDLDRATQLIADAERIAKSSTDGYSRNDALADVASVLAAIDIDRAEHIAMSIRNKEFQSRAFAGIVKAVAAADPDRAKRIVESMTDDLWKVEALVAIAVQTWQPADPLSAALLRKQYSPNQELPLEY